MVQPLHVEGDEVAILRDSLSAHRSVVLGALHAGADVDVNTAFAIHAELSQLLARWDEFSVNEQREIVRTIEYVVNADDEVPDLESPDGFADDWEQVRNLHASLGYGWRAAPLRAASGRQELGWSIAGSEPPSEP